MIALTHLPSPLLPACERTFVAHEEIDHLRATQQHAAYCRLLSECGAEVRILDDSLDLPDSVFIEDTAVVLDEMAILASMGAASRREEPRRIEPHLKEFRDVVRFDSPATLEGGDVLCIGRTLLVGQSRRTNAAGIEVFAALARRHGYRVQTVPVHGCLHLKTACTALPDGRLLIKREWIDVTVLRNYERIPVPENEPWAANVLLIGDVVLMASAHVRTIEMVQSLGFAVKPVDVSEFAKAEGGVTCLSLLIP
jgi:dimethylargininase